MNDRGPRRDPRKVHIPAPDPAAPAGPPPRPGAPARKAPPAAAEAGASVFAPSGGTTSAPPRPRPAPTRSPGPPAAKPAPRAKRGRRVRKRPKLRRILLLTSIFLPLLLLLGAVGGYLYAKSVFDRIEKIPLADVLSPGGDGTNYLIVGSDTREVDDLVDAGLNPGAFEAGGGQRSDTMLLLRFVDGEAKMMSIPRDLYVPIADTGASSKINSAYNGGPERLIRTVQGSLGVPIHHYMEVDFVSFAKLVDSLGGITIDFPNPALDRNSGLAIPAAGPNELDGAQALAYVRSRHYEIVGGNGEVQPIEVASDLGRVLRQQRFLTTVFGKLGGTKNPFTLAKAAGAASGGLRIDDTLGLLDAIRFAWRLRALDPTPVELPVEVGSNSSGSVLFLVEPGADAALGQFR
jgi:LCP family protein required for cell wall assembly